mmetsp:Transcript_46092/g.120752  ORF Transcript_46092/g.120752 Transcript_46092/m.120752 type:complete len:211 (+) Transcript_46092:340-972(+)
MYCHAHPTSQPNMKVTNTVAVFQVVLPPGVRIRPSASFMHMCAAGPHRVSQIAHRANSRRLAPRSSCVGAETVAFETAVPAALAEAPEASSTRALLIDERVTWKTLTTDDAAWERASVVAEAALASGLLSSARDGRDEAADEVLRGLRGWLSVLLLESDFSHMTMAVASLLEKAKPESRKPLGPSRVEVRGLEPREACDCSSSPRLYSSM